MVEAVLNVFLTLNSTNNADKELAPVREDIASGILGNKKADSSSFRATFTRKESISIFHCGVQ